MFDDYCRNAITDTIQYTTASKMSMTIRQKGLTVTLKDLIDLMQRHINFEWLFTFAQTNGVIERMHNETRG